MFSYRYRRPSFTVDNVVFGIDEGSDGICQLQVLLIKRKDDPFKGCWALPGGFVEVSDEGDQGEDLEDAARRELDEEAGIKVAYREQLATFGKPKRDPRGRVISVVYYALVRSKQHVAKAGSDASEAAWWPVSEALREIRQRTAFDHDEILALALKRLRAKVRYEPIIFGLVPREFSLSELQAVYEAVLERPLDRRNFRKRLLAMDILNPAGQRGTGGRKATTYTFDRKNYDMQVGRGLQFAL
jgi:8-oxo-dGTP diphosphatase